MSYNLRLSLIHYFLGLIELETHFSYDAKNFTSYHNNVVFQQSLILFLKRKRHQLTVVVLIEHYKILPIIVLQHLRICGCNFICIRVKINYDISKHRSLRFLSLAIVFRIRFSRLFQLHIGIKRLPCSLYEGNMQPWALIENSSISYRILGSKYGYCLYWFVWAYCNINTYVL